MKDGHERERRWVDRHFARRGTPRTDAAMRDHLPGCDSCRHYYDRHALLAALDPAAAPPVERLARGLDFSAERPRRPRLLALMLVPATLALVVYLAGRVPGADPAFTARGSRAARGPTLAGYDLSRGRSTPLRTRMLPTAELGFAYENPTGYRWLMVVAVDERGKLYWYYPNPDVSNVAVAISSEPGHRELPEAIRHQYEQGKVRILAIFTNQRLTVERMGPLLDQEACRSLRRRLAGITCVEIETMVTANPTP